ncbi:histone H3-like centromeric protein A isoform X2 [Phoenix dactylifera]|uniref:Histone H3-like centromeric protein A isoform X2 n=1 Tax=Phoenix dactylifera TaxID=42345 RepID=A0A8B9ARU0_PHODC|nr:histone H3-like centromeric protein A isoform X2 [Phoenix dactylifera]
MARAKHFSNRPRRRPKKRFQWNQPSQQQAGEASTSGTPSRPTRRGRPSARGGEPETPQEGGTPADQARRGRRLRPGTAALREIRKLQKTWKLLIPFAPFFRLVKEITNFYSRDVSRWTAEAMVAIQECKKIYSWQGGLVGKGIGEMNQVKLYSLGLLNACGISSSPDI